MGVEKASVYTKDTIFLPLISSPLIYASLLHNLLIAANRAFSVLFPLHYSEWWTRKTILTVTLSVWAVHAVIKAIEVAVSALVTFDNSFFNAVYSRLQPITTYASLALYAISLLWALVSRPWGTGGLYSRLCLSM